VPDIKIGNSDALYQDGSTSWETHQVRDEWVIITAISAGAKDHYIHDIVEFEENTEAGWLLKMKLPIAREKA
jgi:hypothetical protein